MTLLLGNLLKESGPITVWLGAGTSRPMDVPLTSELITLFRAETGVDVEDYESIRRDRFNLLRFCEWTSEKCVGRLSFVHFVFSVLWLKNIIQNLVTTNWDLLLEYQIERIYDSAYVRKDPFGEITIATSDYRHLPGWDPSIENQLKLDANELFFQSPLDQKNLFWQPRYEIVYDDTDLDATSDKSKALYKIHGSPFFLFCPECGPYERWRFFSREAFENRCTNHPSRKLLPQIVLPNEQIDKPHSGTWNQVKNMLSSSRFVIVVGYSGADQYVKDYLEGLGTVHVFNKSLGNWDAERICFHESIVERLAPGLTPFLR